MRKLASIRTIDEVAPIPGADLIEKVRLCGWWCVAKKGEFKQGDLCVYCEIDCLLPPVGPFTFLEKTGRKKSIINDKEYEGYRLRTVRLRNQISQGLALPMSYFKGLPTEVGADVTNLLGIVKYEPPVPACISGEVVGSFPGLIPRTDEERIQNLNIADYQGKPFYVTEKINGTSSTFYKLDNYFGACGHNMNFKEAENNTFWKLAYQVNLKEKLQEGFAIQGEVAGEGIQKNPLKLSGQKIFVFYVFDIQKYEYLNLEDMELFCKEIGLAMVPVVERNLTISHSMDQLLSMANRKSLVNPQVKIEGLVFRMRGSQQKISFKVISNEHLLENVE